MSTTQQDDDALEKGPAPAPAPAQAPHFDKEKTMTDYETQLLKAKWLASISAALFSLNWFLGICALTWASAVILGGLISEIGHTDFYFVSALLLLEALRLATATFFANFVTHKLVYRSTLPALLRYDDKDRHRMLAFVRVLDPAFLLIVLAFSVFLPLNRISRLPRHLPDPKKPPGTENFDGLHHSLRIFYILVLVNASFAVVGVGFSKILIVPCFTTTFSLRRYYDHMVWRGMEKGLLYSTDFDFITFAFKALADEYRRNLRAPVVYELYGDLINYLYAHHRGFDAARIAMDSDDHCEQEAAANIVGLWATLGGAAASLPLQSRLLTKLADALDHQETGRAATSSFESIAKLDAEGQLLEVENGRGEKLITILCKHIRMAVKAKKEDKALVFLKVFIQLMEREDWRQHPTGNLVVDLHKVFTEPNCKKRTVGVAGKVLKLMGEGPSDEEIDQFRRSPPPQKKEHILDDEVLHIKELLNIDPAGGQPLPWARVEPRGDTWPRENVNYTKKIIGINLTVFLLTCIAVVLGLKKIHI